jgi:hypothetical protein
MKESIDLTEKMQQLSWLFQVVTRWEKLGCDSDLVIQSRPRSHQSHSCTLYLKVNEFTLNFYETRLIIQRRFRPEIWLD